LTTTYAGIAASPAAKRAFIAELREALEAGRGYAAGKIGNTERSLLLYPLVIDQLGDPGRRRAFELALSWKLGRHGGVFPTRPEFVRTFAPAYAAAVKQLDCLGLFAEDWDQNEALLRFHGYAGRTLNYRDQEPDRSRPNDEGQCYLPLFRGRKVLLVCPFAELLRARATRETFEAVWAKTGKPWFEPAAVEAVELPYGYARSTQESYPDVLALESEIRCRIEAHDYDVALIGAGTLGVVLAAALKARGKVAIALGGHLQVLFGVSGSRWKDWSGWKRDYFNQAWIELPERYRADPEETDENYW
jgi:hypothetical protein